MFGLDCCTISGRNNKVLKQGSLITLVSRYVRSVNTPQALCGFDNGRLPTPKLSLAQDAAARLDTRGHLCALLCNSNSKKGYSC